MKSMLSCLMLMWAVGTMAAQPVGHRENAKSVTKSTVQNKVIESYIAPQDMFPAEGQYKRPPLPMLAYDRPQGQLIGAIQMEQPQCLLPMNKDTTGCQTPLEFVFKASGNVDRFKVEIAQWNYETMGLVSYAPSIKRGLHVWSRVEHEKGSVWVRTQAEDVHSYEDVAYLVEDIAQFCPELGNACTLVTPQAKAQMQQLANLITCYPTPYTIVERMTYNGKRYYKLDIDTSGEHPTTLPHPIYVPTRDSEGRHTGTFYARGC